MQDNNYQRIFYIAGILPKSDLPFLENGDSERATQKKPLASKVKIAQWKPKILNTTVCGPWSAPFPKMIKYFVEKKNTLNSERYRDLLISILSYDEVSAFLLWEKARN